MRIAAESEYQRNWYQHFHQTGIVVMVHVGTVNPASGLRNSKPIELARRTQALKDREHGDRGAVDHSPSRNATKLAGVRQSLGEQEACDCIGYVKQKCVRSSVPVHRNP